MLKLYRCKSLIADKRLKLRRHWNCNSSSFVGITKPQKKIQFINKLSLHHLLIKYDESIKRRI